MYFTMISQTPLSSAGDRHRKTRERPVRQDTVRNAAHCRKEIATFTISTRLPDKFAGRAFKAITDCSTSRSHFARSRESLERRLILNQLDSHSLPPTVSLHCSGGAQH